MRTRIKVEFYWRQKLKFDFLLKGITWGKMETQKKHFFVALYEKMSKIHHLQENLLFVPLGENRRR